jgi:hypothetical protein
MENSYLPTVFLSGRKRERFKIWRRSPGLELRGEYSSTGASTLHVADKFSSFFCLMCLCKPTPIILPCVTESKVVQGCLFFKTLQKFRKKTGLMHSFQTTLWTKMIDVSSRPAEPAHHLVLNEEDLAYEEEIIREVPSHHLFTD